MLPNKIIAVTGGTRGIGKSVVLEFLKQKAQVVAVYSQDGAAAERIKENLSDDQRKRLLLCKGSIKDIGFLQGLFKDVEAKFGKLDILVNSAGINKDNLFLDMEEGDWNDVVATNVKGTLNACLLASEIMKKSTGPSYIVNISSISGVFGRAGQANYACSKGAIIGITKLLAKKLAKYNIFVNTVVPGLIRTEMITSMPEEKITEITNATILKRIGEPEEVAKTISFLVSGNFSYVSGTCIRVDGGYSK
jgi:3-oxoacyl-[acyl-carrier protein] reductase